jgi:hypothetical protein
MGQHFSGFVQKYESGYKSKPWYCMHARIEAETHNTRLGISQ